MGIGGSENLLCLDVSNATANAVYAQETQVAGSPTFPTLANGLVRTIEFWFKPTVADGALGTPVSCYVFATAFNPSFYQLFDLKLSYSAAQSRLTLNNQCRLYQSNEALYTIHIEDFVMVPEQWYHGVLTFETEPPAMFLRVAEAVPEGMTYPTDYASGSTSIPAASNAAFFFMALYGGQGSSSIPAGQAESVRLAIGSSWGFFSGKHNPWKGQLAEVRLWTKLAENITSATISTYTSTFPHLTTTVNGLRLYWRVNEPPSAATIQDLGWSTQNDAWLKAPLSDAHGYPDHPFQSQGQLVTSTLGVTGNEFRIGPESTSTSLPNFAGSEEGRPWNLCFFQRESTVGSGSGQFRVGPEETSLNMPPGPGSEQGRSWSLAFIKRETEEPITGAFTHATVGQKSIPETSAFYIQKFESTAFTGGYGIATTYTSTDGGEFRVYRDGVSRTASGEFYVEVQGTPSSVTTGASEFRVGPAAASEALSASEFNVQTTTTKGSGSSEFLTSRAYTVEKGGAYSLTASRTFPGGIGGFRIFEPGSTVISGEFAIDGQEVFPKTYVLPETSEWRLCNPGQSTALDSSGFNICIPDRSTLFTGEFRTAVPTTLSSPPAGEFYTYVERTGGPFQGEFVVAGDSVEREGPTIEGEFAILNMEEDLRSMRYRVNTMWRQSRS